MNFKLLLCTVSILLISSINCMDNALLEDYTKLTRCIREVPLDKSVVKETYQSVLERMKEEIRKLKRLMQNATGDDREEDGDEDDRLQTTEQLYKSYLYDLSSNGECGHFIDVQIEDSGVKSFDALKQEVDN